MNVQDQINNIYRRYLVPGNHGASDYFSVIRELLVLPARLARHAPGAEHALSVFVKPLPTGGFQSGQDFAW